MSPIFTTLNAICTTLKLMPPARPFPWTLGSYIQLPTCTTWITYRHVKFNMLKLISPLELVLHVAIFIPVWGLQLFNYPDFKKNEVSFIPFLPLLIFCIQVIAKSWWLYLKSRINNSPSLLLLHWSKPLSLPLCIFAKSSHLCELLASCQ